MKNTNYQIVEIRPNKLFVEKGFNPREAIIGDLCYEQEPVKSTIISIKQAYKEGRCVDLIKVVKRGDAYLVRQGHCRYQALNLALAEGANISQISVILLSYENEIEEYLENLDGNRSNGLNPVGQALAQAISLGYTVEDLAIRYQRSNTAISNMLKILDMPVELQRLISFNIIKKTLAIEIMLKYSNDHQMVLEHLKRCSYTMPTIESVSVASDDKIVVKPVNKNAMDIKEIPVAPEGAKNIKTGSVTRSSLGIKRLSHKKTERLKSEFIGLIENISNLAPEKKTLTELVIDKRHSPLFENVNNNLIKTTS
ncbi:hypothetical protein QPK13_23230 [Photorhabdus tasmaniensis]